VFEREREGGRLRPNLADNLAEEGEERPLFVFRRFRGCSTFLSFLFGQQQQQQQLKIKTLNKELNQKCVEVKIQANNINNFDSHLSH
jgi:hypothetical protein